MTKAEQFTAVILDTLNEMINNEAITPDEISDNATEFFHALGNMAPCFIYNKLCNANEDLLSFNHIMNKIVVQNIKIG